MRGDAHVRFGGRTRETDRLRGRHRALVRPNSRWITVGNVRERSLAEIITGPAMRRAEEVLAASFGPVASCNPQCCPSTMCDPQCSPSCSPSCGPAGNCRPIGNCAPNY